MTDFSNSMFDIIMNPSYILFHWLVLHWQQLLHLSCIQYAYSLLVNIEWSHFSKIFIISVISANFSFLLFFSLSCVFRQFPTCWPILNSLDVSTSSSSIYVEVPSSQSSQVPFSHLKSSIKILTFNREAVVHNWDMLHKSFYWTTYEGDILSKLTHRKTKRKSKKLVRFHYKNYLDYNAHISFVKNYLLHKK